MIAERQEERGNVTREAETRVISPSKRADTQQKLEEARIEPFLEPLRDCGAQLYCFQIAGLQNYENQF